MAGIRVAINGFGRIGRNALRVIEQVGSGGLEVVAINDLTNPGVLAHLLEYDSINGRWPTGVRAGEAGEDYIAFFGKRIQVLAERDPKALPWGDLGIDVVIESTGRFANLSDAGMHVEAGARRVVISAPAGDAVPTYVIGVNADQLAADHTVVSNASCTTNCLAPVVKVLEETVGVEQGLMTTTHAYTADQNLQDGPHKDLRRARAAATNLVPTSTGAARAIGLVIPELKGKLDGFAVRVPVAVGSMVDLNFLARRPTSVTEINAALEHAAGNGLKSVMEFTTAPLVSSDIVGNPSSAIVDGQLTTVVGECFAKVVAWYDNEWGYANRLVELTQIVGQLAGQ